MAEDVGVERETLTIRGLSRVYGVSRDWIADRIRARELLAIRRGTRRIEVFRRDFEALLRTYSITAPGDDLAAARPRLGSREADPAAGHLAHEAAEHEGEHQAIGKRA